MSWRKWIEPWFAIYGLLGIVAAGVLPVLLPQFVNEAGSAADVGIVMAVLNVGGLSAPLWGLLADRQLHKQIVLGSLAFIGVAVVLMANSGAIPVWLILAFVLGAGITAVNTVAGLLVVGRHPRAEWDQRLGWLLTAFGGGQVIGLLFASLFSASASGTGLLVSGAIALIACVLGAFLLPAASQPRPQTPVHLPSLAFHIPHIPASPSSAFYHWGQTNLRSVAKVIRTPFGTFVLAFGLLTLASALIFTPYPLLFQSLYGIAPSMGALIYGVGAAVAIFWYSLAGSIGHRIGDRKVFNGALIGRIACFAALVLIIPLSGAVKNPLAALSFMIVVNTWPFLSVAATVMVAELATIPEGEAMGIYNAVNAIMGTIGALLSGLLAQQFGYGALPLGAAIIGGATLVVMLGARSRIKRSES